MIRRLALQYAAAGGVGPEAGTIIEVKLRRSTASAYWLAEIERRVSAQRGWECRAIYLNSLTDGRPPISKPTLEQIQATFGKIEALTKSGQFPAALVTARVALESLARLASASSEASRSIGFSPIQPIQTLAKEGYIENATADRHSEKAKERNAVVHDDLPINAPAQ